MHKKRGNVLLVNMTPQKVHDMEWHGKNNKLIREYKCKINREIMKDHLLKCAMHNYDNIIVNEEPVKGKRHKGVVPFEDRCRAS